MEPDVKEWLDESLWWNTYNATLQGCIDQEHAPDALQLAHTLATQVHGFTPEGYKGPREENTNKDKE